MLHHIEPTNPYGSKFPRQKTHIELLEEEQLYHQIRLSEQQTTQTTTVTATGNSSVGVGGSVPFSFFHPSLTEPRFTASITNGDGPLEVIFTNTSDFPIETRKNWLWIFGDGNTNKGLAPSYIYQNTGSFTVELQVSNSFGVQKSLTRTNYITVNRPSVTSSFTFTTSSYRAPFTATFVNNSINTSNVKSTTYFWDFGDGNTSNEINPIHIYNATGSFTTSLQVTGSYGIASKVTASIIASRPQITASFTYNTSSKFITNTINFTNISVYDGNPPLVYFWDFGDGNTTSSVNPSHVYTTGSFTASLQITGSLGFASKATSSFTVTNPSPNLATSVSASMIGRIQGLTPNTGTYNLYSVSNDASRSYTRNSSLWASDVDWSCIPVNEGGGGVLVTPDILIQANHSHYAGNIYFVDSNNVTYSGSIISGVNIPNTDIFVAKLSSSIHRNIKPAQILPTSSFSGSNGNVNITTSDVNNRSLMSAFTNQFRTLKIGLVYTLLFGDAGVITAQTPPLSNWYSAVIGGDSGSPFFIIIDGKPIVLGVWYESDLSSLSLAPFISSYITDINTAIISLGSTSSLSTINLNGYQTYP